LIPQVVETIKDSTAVKTVFPDFEQVVSPIISIIFDNGWQSSQIL